MAQGLSISNIVNISVTLAPVAAPVRNFGAGIAVGSSDVIDINERIRAYSNMAGISADFSTTDVEYKAALLHFGQSPQPSIYYVGRWARTATRATLRSGVLTPTERQLSNFTAITAGAMFMRIDEVPRTIDGVNWGAITNLNGAAALVQAEMPAGSSVVWDANSSRFRVQGPSAGQGATISYAQAPTAWGSWTFAANPTSGDTMTVNGTLVTFTNGTPTGNQVKVESSLTLTLAGLVAFLNASADVNISKMVHNVVGSVLYSVSKLTGTSGNAYTMAKVSTAITVSGATLSGGLGTDISTRLKLTSSAASAPANGIDPETLTEALEALIDVSGDWYAAVLADENVDIPSILSAAALIQAQQKRRRLGVTIVDTRVLDATITDDLASQLKDLGYFRTFTQYSGTNPQAVASFFGRASTVNFQGSNTTITMKFKQEPGVVAESITETQARTLKAKNCNVFVNYDNDTAILQEGVNCDGSFFDEWHGLDWLENDLQTAIYNALYTFPKIPQTDDGMTILQTVMESRLIQAVTNGLVAPGVWNAAGFGQLLPGDTLQKGFYVYAPPVATQSQADREARKSVVFQIAIKFAGAVHSVDVLLTANR